MIIFLISVVNAISFSRSVAEQLFQNGKPGLLLFYDDSHLNQLIEFRKIQQDDNLQIIEAKDTDIGVSKLMQLLQLTHLPSIKLIKSDGPSWSDVKVISYDDQIQVGKLDRFIERYITGLLFYDIISEDIPAKKMEDGIELLVGHTFEEHVQDSSRHYLVYFYSTDCDLCQSILYNLIQFNNQVKNGKTSIKPNHLKVGKINGELNRIAGVKITQYPTLYLYRMDDKVPVEYRGDRTSEGMIMWIESVNQ